MSSPCTALSNAIKAKGHTHSQIAQKVGSTEQRIRDIVGGRERPTQQEFDKLARSLGITSQSIPHATA
ncbi:hypothetical protein F5888DRAFT_1656379 [Russula emetica]|nr:hypothetical protein F5888DRAFT_1656379 [Russula emetica]